MNRLGLTDHFLNVRHVDVEPPGMASKELTFSCFSNSMALKMVHAQKLN